MEALEAPVLPVTDWAPEAKPGTCRQFWALFLLAWDTLEGQSTPLSPSGAVATAGATHTNVLDVGFLPAHSSLVPPISSGYLYLTWPYPQETATTIIRLLTTARRHRAHRTSFDVGSVCRAAHRWIYTQFSTTTSDRFWVPVATGIQGYLPTQSLTLQRSAILALTTTSTTNATTSNKEAHSYLINFERRYEHDMTTAIFTKPAQ